MHIRPVSFPPSYLCLFMGVLIAFACLPATAAVIRAVKNGQWDSEKTWDLNRVPLITDDVYIDGYDVTINTMTTIGAQDFFVGTNSKLKCANAQSILGFNISGNVTILGEVCDGVELILNGYGYCAQGNFVKLSIIGDYHLCMNTVVEEDFKLLGTLYTHSYSLTLNGDVLASTGSFVADSGTVIYNGNIAQPLLGWHYYNLTIAGGSIKTAAGPATVARELTLSSGRIDLSSHNLTMNYGSSIVGASSSRYLITSGSGSLTHASVGSSAVEFPIGTASTYNPVTIANSGIVDDFSARVGTAISPLPSDPTRVVNRMWTLSEASPGGSPSQVTFQWNVSEEAANFSHADVVSVFRLSPTWLELLSAVNGSGPWTAATNTATFGAFHISSTGMLPVIFSSSSVALHGNDVVVSWTTAMEENCLGFEVRRREADEEVWSFVGAVAGQGTTLTPHSYSMKDNLPWCGGEDIRYRITAIDAKGMDRMVEIDLERNPSSAVLTEFNVFPFPVREFAQLHLRVTRPTLLRITIVDQVGSEVPFTERTRYFDVGHQEISLPVSAMRNGLYFVHASGDRVHEIVPMVLLR